MIEEKLMALPFVKESVNSVRASINRFRKFVLNRTYSLAWRQLLVQKESQNRQSMLNKFQNKQSSIASTVIEMIVVLL